MSFFSGEYFFTVLILVLAGALILGFLEKPLKWYNITLAFLNPFHITNPLNISNYLLFKFNDIKYLYGYFWNFIKGGYIFDRSY